MVNQLTAAIYLRMSKDDQINSLDRQRRAVLAYCEQQGYVVVGEYVDAGIPDDEFERRSDLQRLLADAAAGKFQVIVVEEPARLSRQNAIAFIRTIVGPLSDAGIILDSVKDGRVRWDDLGGFLMMSIQSHGSSDEAKKISLRALGTLANLAAAGRPLSKPPYGYRAEKVPHPSKSGQFVNGRFVVQEPAASIVRWLFDTYAHQDVSLSWLCQELTRTGAVPPGEGLSRRKHDPKWTPWVIRYMLKNKAYLGISIFNRRSGGKYHRRCADGLHPVAKRAPSPTVNDEKDWVVRPGAHAPLVEQHVFDAVQVKLIRNKTGRPTVKAGGSLLSGLLVCGHCGSTLHLMRSVHGSYYVCGTNRAFACTYSRVREDTALAKLTTTLQEQLIEPERLAFFMAEATRLDAEARRQADPAVIAQQLREVDNKLLKAERDLIEAPADEKDLYRSERRRLLAERAALDAKSCSTVSVADVLQSAVEAKRLLLLTRASVLQSGDHSHIRAILNRLVRRVVVWWEMHQKTGLRRFVPVRGQVDLWPDESLSSLCGSPRPVTMPSTRIRAACTTIF